MSSLAGKAKRRKQSDVAPKSAIKSVPSFSKAQSCLLKTAFVSKALPAVIDEAAQLVEEMFDGAACLIELFPSQQVAACRSARLESGPLHQMFDLSATPVSALRAAHERGVTVRVASFLRDKGWTDHGLRAVAAGYVSCVATPLHCEGEPIGAIAIYFPSENGLDDELCSKFESFASVVAMLPGMMASRANVSSADERFSQLASTIPGVVYQRVVYPSGEIRYTYISEGAKDLFGVDAKTILSDPEALFNHYSEEYRTTFRQKLIEASKTLSNWDVEAKILRPDGKVCYTHAIANPRREADGSVVWTGVILDTTRMKVAEMEAAATERESREAVQRFLGLASTIPGVVYQRVVKPDGDVRYTYISEGAKNLFGVDAETIVRDPQALFNHYGAEYRATFRQKLIEASRTLSTWDVEAQIQRPDGTIKHTHAIAHPRRELDGSVVWTGVILDATRMKLAELEAAETESKTREAIVESFTQGLLLYGPDDTLVICNSKFLSINPGLESIAVPGAKYTDILKAELDSGRVGQITESDTTFEFCERLAKHNKKEGSVFERQISNDRWILINDNPTDSGGKVVLYTDVTELKRRELHIEHIAHHDALTGLPNRVLFRKKLEEALDRAEIEQNDVAVIYIDLDRFKAVNDTLGHPIGDALLQIVGKRIQECMRASDVPARLGGDEFALVIPKNATTETLTSLAWRLIDTLSRPCEIQGHTVIVGASLGIATGREGGSQAADHLLKSADLAVYRAKSDGKGTFRFFEAEMDAIAQERRLLEMDLRHAIGTEQLQVHYQPQVDVFTSQMVGAEALIRWCHPVRGNVPPADFIPLAEETGLISEIGPWVLRRACEDAVKWPLAARVAVNVSPAQFQSGNFIDIVRQVLADTGLRPSRLEIEITESMLLRNTDSNLKTLWGLKDLGVRVSMDDFGTGYSSLGNLRSFPFDKIKIDRSFINDLKNSVDAAAIIRAVVSLGRSLGITTTAEGVETRDQLTYLRAEGCSEVQGFYFSEAQPTDAIHQMLVNSPNGVVNPR